MSLKKRLAAILVLVCLLGVAFYVSLSGMTIQNETSDTLFNHKETIYFWYSDDTLTEYVSSAAVNFGELYDVRVIPVLKSGAEYLEEINQATLEDEQFPDAYLISNDSLGKAYLAGLATAISDNGEVCNTENFPQVALSAVTYDDTIIAYPYFYETSAYLYNKTYLEDYARNLITAETSVEPETGTEDATATEQAPQIEITDEQIEERVAQMLPTTMDELLTFADGYDAPEAVESILKWDVSDIFYNYYFIGNYMVVGGESGDDKQNIDIYNLETINCLKAYQKLNQFFYIEPKEVTYDSVMQDFMVGKVVFTVATTDAVAMLEKAKEEGTFTYDYDVMNIPQISDSLLGRSLSVTNAVAINGYGENKDLANEFAKFLTTEYVDKFYDRTGKMAASYNAPLENDYASVFMREYEQSISLPKMMETSNFWVQAEILFSKVWNGENINDLVRELSEQMMTQVTGETYTEEYIEEPEEEVVEEAEYIDDEQAPDSGEGSEE